MDETVPDPPGAPRAETQARHQQTLEARVTPTAALTFHERELPLELQAPREGPTSATACTQIRNTRAAHELHLPHAQSTPGLPPNDPTEPIRAISVGRGLESRPEFHEKIPREREENDKFCGGRETCEGFCAVPRRTVRRREGRDGGGGGGGGSEGAKTGIQGPKSCLILDLLWTFNFEILQREFGVWGSRFRVSESRFWVLGSGF